MHTQVAEALSALKPVIVDNRIGTFGDNDFDNKDIIIGAMHGHVRCSGDDASEFLNRLTSITPHKMEDGTGSPGFLLEHNGKIKVSFELYRHTKTDISLFCQHEDADRLHMALDMFHFGEALTLTIEPQYLAVLVHENVDSLQTITSQEADFLKWRGQQDYRLWFAKPERVIEIVQTGAADGRQVGGLDDFERVRIREGIASAPYEWNDRFTPLDVKGHAGIVEQKGCYPGQEVIERTIAIGRPARRLVKVKGASIMPEQKIMNASNQAIGFLTSTIQATPSSRVGLAVIKSKVVLTETYHTDGESIQLFDIEG